MRDESSIKDRANFIASYLRHAKEDIAASYILGERNNHYEAYHAEQAMEKIVLALAEADGVYINKKTESHQLDITVRKLDDENPYKTRLLHMTFLQTHATTERYPTSSRGRVNRILDRNIVQMRSARAKIADILEELCRNFGVDSDFNSDKPARTIDPPRIIHGNSNSFLQPKR